MGKLHEDELIRGLILGQSAAFEQLAAQYERPLINFIAAYVGDLAAAEDLYQETFVRVIRSISDYRPEAGLATWIYTIARNLALDHLRRRKRRREVSLARSEGPEEANVIFLDRRSSAAPEAAPEAAERSDKLLRSMQRLSPKKREAVVLRFFSDMNYDEMSRLLETPVGTLKFRVHEALQDLSGLLRDAFGEEAHEVSGSA